MSKINGIDWQWYTDYALAKTILPFIPRQVTPNQVTYLRFALLPVVFYYNYTESYGLGVVFFSIAGLTDAIDGAMARTRDQITELGKVIDPLADKGLIAIPAFLFIPKFFGWPLLIVIIMLELMHSYFAASSRKIIGYNPGGNWAGKFKMVIQVFGFSFIFLGLAVPASSLITLGGALLYSSLPFAFLQSFFYPKTIEQGGKN